MFDFNETIFGGSEKGWYDCKEITPDDYKRCCFETQAKMGDFGFFSNIIENHDEPRGVSHYIPEGHCSTSGLLSDYRARKGLPADAPMDGRIFFEAVHAGETEANETLRSFCRAVAVQIYNLNVLLDLEKVASVSPAWTASKKMRPSMGASAGRPLRAR